MKKIFALLMVLVMAAGLAACSSSGGSSDGGGKEPGIAGVWKSAEVEYEGSTMSMEEFAENVIGMKGYTMTFTINEDGTFSETEGADGYGSYTYEGTWKQDGDKYSFTVEDITIVMEIRDGRMVNVDKNDLDGALMYFEKQ